MKILICGKHFDIGDPLRAYISQSVEHNIIKFFEDAVSIHITISKSHNVFKTDIIVNEGTGTGVIIKSSNEDHDVYKSFEVALSKFTKRLSKYKAKIRNHHKRKLSSENFIERTGYVFALDDDIPVGDAPVVIAEKKVSLEKMSVADAVMQMELMNLPTFLFININTNTVNVLYHRRDGNIAWIDSTATIQLAYS